MNRTRLLIALIITAALASTAHASSPTAIDPGAYIGRYFISGVGQFSGPASLSLAPGTYTLETGAGVAGSAFLFTVDATGQVGGISNPAAATGSGNTLAFKNANVVIDPVAYTGRYFLSSHFPTPFRGRQTVTLVPGLTYYTDDGSYIGGSTFYWSVDAAGNITNVSNPAAATATGGTLIFKNTTIGVNPSRYIGPYIISAFAPTALSGVQRVVLIPGLAYQLDTGANIGGSAFYFAVDGAGQVTTTSAAALGSGSTLTLNNVNVTINPASYSGLYSLSATTPKAWVTGIQTVVLVPALSYTIDNGSSIGGSALAFVVDAAGRVGAVTPAAAGVGSGNILVFGNIAVRIDPGTYTGAYVLGGVQGLTGVATPILIPELVTTLAAGGGAAYITARSTGVTPPTATLTIAGQPQTFSLTISTSFDPTTTTALTSSPNPSGTGQPVRLTAFVNARPGSGAPTGTVQFFDGATQLGSAVVASAGASISVGGLAVRAHSLTARYSGDARFAASASAPLTQTVQGLAASTTTRLMSAPNPSLVGATVTLVATVRPRAGTAAPTGAVQFFDGQAALGLALVSGGRAAFTTSALIAGTHVLTAAYLGDTTFAGSTSLPVAHSAYSGAAPAATRTTLASTPSPSTLGQSVTFTARVTAAGTPTGTVQFSVDGAVAATVPLAAGRASFAAATLTRGTHVITATYLGDSAFAGSTSRRSQRVR